MKLFPLLAILLLLPGCARPENPSPSNGDDFPVDERQSVAALEQSATQLKRNGRGNVIEVSFRGAQISDADLAPLAGLPELKDRLNPGESKLLQRRLGAFMKAISPRAWQASRSSSATCRTDTASVF